MRNERVFNAQLLVQLGSWPLAEGERSWLELRQYETVNLLFSFFDSEKVKMTVPAEAKRWKSKMRKEMI